MDNGKGNRLFGPDGPTLEELGVDKNLAKRARRASRMSEAASRIGDRVTANPTHSRDTDAVDSSPRHGRCECGRQDYLMPLHGEKGGRLFCLICRGAWDAKYGKLTRIEHVLQRVLQSFYAAGGNESRLLQLRVTRLFGKRSRDERANVRSAYRCAFACTSGSSSTRAAATCQARNSTAVGFAGEA